MKIEVGKFYRDSDGRKVGPMENGRTVAWACLDGRQVGYFHDGRAAVVATSGLVAEWTDAAPAEPEIEWGPWGGPGSEVGDFQAQSIGGALQWRYPVQKQPVVETFTLFGNAIRRGAWTTFAADKDTHRITMTIIDGVVQPTADVVAL